jgi:hypothetical protein
LIGQGPPQRRIDWPSLMRLPDESELRFREGDLRGLHVSSLKDDLKLDN